MVSGSRYCSAANCKGKGKFLPKERLDKLAYFRFPTDKERCDIWVEHCGRKDLRSKTVKYLSQNCRLCSDHFEESMKFKYSNRLVWNAIPTIFDGVTFPVPKKLSEVQNRVANDADLGSPQTQIRRSLVSTDHAYCAKQPVKCYKRISPDISQSGISQSEISQSGISQSGISQPRINQPEISQAEISQPEIVPTTDRSVNGNKVFNIAFRPNSVEEDHGYCVSKVNPKKSSKGIQTIVPSTYCAMQYNSGSTVGSQPPRVISTCTCNELHTYKKQMTRKTSTFRVKLHRLRKKVQRLEAEKQVARCDESIEHMIFLAGKYMEGPALQFFINQLKMSSCKVNGRRYSKECLSLAMDLFKDSQIAYEYLSKIFILPLPSAIRRRIRGAARAGREETQNPWLDTAEPDIVEECDQDIGGNCSTELPQVSKATSNSNLPSIVNRLVGELGPLVVVSEGESLVREALDEALDGETDGVVKKPE